MSSKEINTNFFGPHGHDYSHLVESLREIKKERLVYIPNPGNAGDALIALATYKLFDDLNLDIEIGDQKSDYPDANILYGGGGSLVINYPNAADFIKRNHLIAKKFILLPSTVRAFPELISSMGSNCHLFAREERTLEYLEKYNTDSRISLSHDLAFLLDNISIKKSKWDRKFVFSEDRWYSWLKMVIKFGFYGRFFTSPLSALRIDSEATSVTLPHTNHDLSHYFTTRDMLAGRMHPEICATSIKMMRLLMVQHKKIKTNRLHLAILGAITGVQVEMLPNSYDKNSSIFKHSISGIFPNVSLEDNVEKK